MEPTTTTTPPLKERVFLNSEEVMKLFRFGNRTAFSAWVATSGVPHVRLNGRNHLFDEQELAKWVAAQTRVGKEAAK